LIDLRKTYAKLRIYRKIFFCKSGPSLVLVICLMSIFVTLKAVPALATPNLITLFNNSSFQLGVHCSFSIIRCSEANKMCLMRILVLFILPRWLVKSDVSPAFSICGLLGSFWYRGSFKSSVSIYNKFIYFQAHEMIFCNAPLLSKYTTACWSYAENL